MACHLYMPSAGRRLSSLSFAPRYLEISQVASCGAATEASQALEKSRRIRTFLAAAAAVAGGGGGPRPHATSAVEGHTLTAVLRAEGGRSGACIA